jgi:hypothetical protein
MPNPFTIRIYVPEGDPEGVRIIDRLSSTAKFLAFPREKWDEVKTRQDIMGAGIYILSGYSEKNPELPTIYIGQADVLRNRIEQHIKTKDFWDRVVMFTSININATHARWLEYALIKRLHETNRSIVENGNQPQEPTISEAERAEMQVLLTEIYQTLPLVDLRAFEKVKTIVSQSEKPISPIDKIIHEKRDTIVVPAQEEGFKRVFLGENTWWAIRISGGMLDKIKYIAAYQTTPVSAITHYASVKSIEQFGEEGKYKLIFSEPAKKLEKPIPSDLGSGGMQSPRYTSFDKLIKATKMSELF